MKIAKSTTFINALKSAFKIAAMLALATFLTPLTPANADEGDFNEYTN